ncbi:MAG: sigma-70 family RNA polymerase sigma factor [Archangium sp.]
MTEPIDEELVVTLQRARQRFLDLVADVRPELHRYCARMTGSVFDGEDVVQEALAKAHFALAQLGEPPPLRPWLFRIAHNTALDFLRRAENRLTDATHEVELPLPAVEPEPDPALVEAAIIRFTALTPKQRSALALKDVIGLTLEETAEAMGTTVLAVKSALSRARAELAGAREIETVKPPEAELSQLRHYAHLFNARDWEGLRALFTDESNVELVSRWQRAGHDATKYFGRYSEVADAEGMRAAAGIADGVPVIAVFRTRHPTYFMRVTWAGSKVASVRDFHFTPWVAREARFTRLR